MYALNVFIQQSIWMWHTKAINKNGRLDLLLSAPKNGVSTGVHAMRFFAKPPCLLFLNANSTFFPLHLPSLSISLSIFPILLHLLIFQYAPPTTRIGSIHTTVVSDFVLGSYSSYFNFLLPRNFAFQRSYLPPSQVINIL